jgi:hypothetical protein
MKIGDRVKYIGIPNNGLPAEKNNGMPFKNEIAYVDDLWEADGEQFARIVLKQPTGKFEKAKDSFGAIVKGKFTGPMLTVHPNDIKPAPIAVPIAGYTVAAILAATLTWKFFSRR